MTVGEEPQEAENQHSSENRIVIQEEMKGGGAGVGYDLMRIGNRLGSRVVENLPDLVWLNCSNNCCVQTRDSQKSS